MAAAARNIIVLCFICVLNIFDTLASCSSVVKVNLKAGNNSALFKESGETFRQSLSNGLATIYDMRCDVCSHHGDINARARDCGDVQRQGYRVTGVYTIFPNSVPVQVRCELEKDGGGWTVIQRRLSRSDFFKTWREYKAGFGDLNTNFWLGNEYIYRLTSSGRYKLRIDMTAPNLETRYAEYSAFAIGSEATKYRLSVSGYSGTAGDSMWRHNGMKFTTKYQDNDPYWQWNCAAHYHSAWWFNDCFDSDLNGEFGNDAYGMGLNWYTWTGWELSLIYSEMKIKKN